jgi:serine/threonine-protein kinase
LFIDIVGYSKLLINEQSEQIQTFRKIVRGAEQFRLAEAEGKLVRLPTGDGAALVFRTNVEAPALCALEISKALKSHPDVHVRMGIHSGPVNEVVDLNGQANIAGAGINIAQRVMDCGDAGHILLSKRVAEDLAQYRQWQPHLRDLGEVEMKHGVRVHVFNLCNEEVGNPEVPEKLRQAERLATSATAPEKSIAVLPFANTSGDPNNEYFSDGLSEELIGVLAKIHGLKTIGRSSSFLFKGTSEDSRTIGRKLGVANLLEGSVRKQGQRVRIVVELIDANDGRALWAETYDRELKDVFAVQSEIATAVTDQLKIKLFGATQKSDAEPSNDNLAAYNAFQQGNFYLSHGNAEDFRKAIEFYNEALRLDSCYALAYANLSRAWLSLGEAALGGDELAVAYGKARRAAETALSLAPNLSEAHEAMGLSLADADFNFETAAIEFQKAEELAPAAAGPKNALTFLLFEEGRLKKGEEMARKALALDPLVLGPYFNLGRILIARQSYDEAETVLRKAIELAPKAARSHMQITNIHLLRGNTAAALEEARLEPAGFWQDYALALARQAQDDRAAGNAALQEFIEKYSVQGPFQIATIYALRKEPGEMFAWLDRAYNKRDAGLLQLLTAPFIHNYRDNPRFDALRRKLKLPAPESSAGKELIEPHR